MSMDSPPPLDPQGTNPFGESNPFSDNPYAAPSSSAGSFRPLGVRPAGEWSVMCRWSPF